jgi:hypothetical protein
MRKLGLIALCGVALVALLVAMLIAAYLVWGLPEELGRVTVNGQVIDLHGAHAGHWMLATLGILLAAMIVIVVVPSVAILAVIVPITLTAAGLLLAAAVVALLLSPLLLLGAWLWKRRRKPATIQA